MPSLLRVLHPKKDEAADNAREDKPECVPPSHHDDDRRSEDNKVDFSVLGNSSLKRYAKVYHMEAPVEAISEGNSRRQLADSVAKHFLATPLKHDETETLLRFIQAVRKS